MEPRQLALGVAQLRYFNIIKKLIMGMSSVERYLKTCAPTGTRTPVLALRGPRPRPLDDGGAAAYKAIEFYHAHPSSSTKTFKQFASLAPLYAPAPARDEGFCRPLS
jgi:hypothetical protein